MLGIGLAGCTVGPDFQSPEITEAPRRSASDDGGVPSRTVEGAVDITWWKSFRDSQLSSLVERLAAQNLDLQTAAERVVQSVAQRQVAASQGLPHIEGQSLSTYNRQSPNGPLSLLTPGPGAPLEYALFRDGLTSSWQLDLFGAPWKPPTPTPWRPWRTGMAWRSRRSPNWRKATCYCAERRTVSGSRSAISASPRKMSSLRIHVSTTESLPPSTWRKPGVNKPPSPRPCRHCVSRRRNSSTRSDCCWAKLPARSRPSCAAPRYCRACRARFRWACPERSYAAGRTSARPRRDCMKPRRRPASRWRASTLT